MATSEAVDQVAQRRLRQRIDCPARAAPCFDEAKQPQRGEVLRYRALADLERLGELGDGLLAHAQRLDDAEADRMGKPLEDFHHPVAPRLARRSADMRHLNIAILIYILPTVNASPLGVNRRQQQLLEYLVEENLGEAAASRALRSAPTGRLRRWRHFFQGGSLPPGCPLANHPSRGSGISLGFELTLTQARTLTSSGTPLLA